MENLEEVFISARHAKMNTNNHIREREELYQKKAIDFLNKYNFNEVVAKACEERRFFIPSIKVEERELAYAITNILVTLGYSAKVEMFSGIYSINVHWNNKL